MPLRRIVLAALFLASCLSVAQAQSWPARPIKLVVPTSAGSATDIMARLLANDVQAAIGGAIFVENIGGGSGIPAHQAVARAEADGYTFMFTNTSGPRHQRGDVQETALRSCEGFHRRRRCHRSRAADDQRAQGRAGKVAAGTHRLRKGQPRQGELWRRRHCRRCGLLWTVDQSPCGPGHGGSALSDRRADGAGRRSGAAAGDGQLDRRGATFRRQGRDQADRAILQQAVPDAARAAHRFGNHPRHGL